MEKILKLMGAGIMRNAIGLIPTRLNSRRLPRKSLKMIENQEILLRDNKVLHNGSVLRNPIVFT